MHQRPRRNRKNAVVRAFTSETQLGPERFVHPLFVPAGADDVPIGSMPGCFRHSQEGLLREAEATLEDGVRSVVLFPAIAESLKTPRGDESKNPEGLIPKTIAEASLLNAKSTSAWTPHDSVISSRAPISSPLAPGASISTFSVAVSVSKLMSMIQSE